MIREFWAYINIHRRAILGILLCALAAYALYLLYAARVQKANAVIVQADRLDQIAKQLERTQKIVQEKERDYNELYKITLQKRGKLTLKTIVRGNPSRLALTDSMLKTSERNRDAPPPVGRGYTRRDDSDFDITTPSAATAYELDLAFFNTPLYGLGKEFVRAELDTGINAIFLAALAVHESSWGNSALARQKNNLFGFGAYDRDPDMANAFSSKGECVAFVARFLREHYLDGSYYRGGTIKDINTLYSSDRKWSGNIYYTMMVIDEHIREKSGL